MMPELIENTVARKLSLPLAALAAALAATSASAQPTSGPEVSPRTAYLEPEEADEDFFFQGEFLGRLNGLARGGACGAQVVAAGHGNFVASRLAGGLPAAGWDRREPQRYAGSRDGQQVNLANDEGDRLVVHRDYLDVFGPDGSHHGRLPRIHRVSPTLGAAPPPGATVLFDREPRLLNNAKLERGALTSGFTTAFDVGDFYLHVEFRVPFMPFAQMQQRGNSGVYLQRRYEVQILDSFGLSGDSGNCGSVYRQQPPNLNMSFPPLSWQTFDIYFRAPRWNIDRATKNENARITVLHNGQAVHWDYEVTSKTGAGQAENVQALPILFQDHGDPVRFRNIWIAFPSPSGGSNHCFPPPLDRSIFALPRRGAAGNPSP